MGFSLFPKTYKFYDLFIQQNKKIIEAANNLNLIFVEFTDVSRHCKEIQLIEAEGNRISRDLVRLLSLTFITPIDREDIHEINVAQEAILNNIKGISNRINMYNFTGITQPSKELVENLLIMLAENESILNNLINKKDAGESVRRVKKLKEDSDNILMHAIGDIYKFDLNNPNIILEIIKWTQIYDRIEKAIIRTENLATIMEGICLKYA